MKEVVWMVEHYGTWVWLVGYVGYKKKRRGFPGPIPSFSLDPKDLHLLMARFPPLYS